MWLLSYENLNLHETTVARFLASLTIATSTVNGCRGIFKTKGSASVSLISPRPRSSVREASCDQEMGQQSLIYSFVSRGTVIVAEYTEFTGNFNSIAAQCLQKLPATSNKFTYNCDGHTFNYLVEDGYSEGLSAIACRTCHLLLPLRLLLAKTYICCLLPLIANCPTKGHVGGAASMGCIRPVMLPQS
ncbi:hypothetical protein ZIOFF_055132 [Zingiber officinale]|uniref:Longin domain-containing protein n=1 Tax=Zingiber officinale TaxID=94328 RepID=A0A8J5FFY7_ZINOF|nr:hypothetical protein ZIOFF_055132 [Zingiber officinale]